MILTYCIRHKPNATLILDARHYTAGTCGEWGTFIYKTFYFYSTID